MTNFRVPGDWARIEEDRVIIEIPFENLKFAVENDEYFSYGTGNEDPIKVSDIDIFAKEFLCELLFESEDGSTLITRMLDEASRTAIENGCEGIVLNES